MAAIGEGRLTNICECGRLATQTSQVEKIVNCFVTGSQVYGTPTPGKSDIDVVVLISPDDIIKLYDMDEVDQDEHHCSADTSIRFGKLNLITCTTEEEFQAWWRARERCIKEKPVTRDRAIEIHKEELGY